MKIYVIVRGWGAYSDRSEVPSIAFSSKEIAVDYVNNLTNLVNEADKALRKWSDEIGIKLPQNTQEDRIEYYRAWTDKKNELEKPIKDIDPLGGIDHDWSWEEIELV